MGRNGYTMKKITIKTSHYRSATIVLSHVIDNDANLDLSNINITNKSDIRTLSACAIVDKLAKRDYPLNILATEAKNRLSLIPSELEVMASELSKGNAQKFAHTGGNINSLRKEHIVLEHFAEVWDEYCAMRKAMVDARKAMVVVA